MKFKWSVFSRAMGEFSASAMLLLVACMGTYNPSGYDNSNLQISLSYGFVVTACTHCFWCVSGAHINPCVTIAGIIVRKIKWDMAILYIICQFLGAFFGYCLATILVFESCFQKGFCTAKPIVTENNAIGIEFILTSSWIYAMCAIWDKRNENFQESVPLRIGMVVSGLAIFGGYFTGAHMNPIRTFVPALCSNNYKQVWTYLVGQISAAFLIPVLWITIHNENGPDLLKRRNTEA